MSDPHLTKDPYENALEALACGKPARNKNVLLVLPAAPRRPPPVRDFLDTGPYEGFTAVASLVQYAGYSLSVLDCRLIPEAEKRNSAISEAAAKADVIGVATYCDSYVYIEETLRAIRAKECRKPVFLGGSLVSSSTRLLMDNLDADFAVLGESELTLLEFLEKLFQPSAFEPEKIKGLAFKKNGITVINEARPPIQNLDLLPFLDFTIWPQYGSFSSYGHLLISSARGCSQNCSFCFKPFPGPRYKSPDYLRRELRHIMTQLPVKTVWINDLTFNASRHHAFMICDVMKEFGLTYHILARVTGIDEEFVTKLKDTGCGSVQFGIESYDNNVLSANNKKTSVSDIDRAIGLMKKARVPVIVLLVVGLKGETEESFLSTLKYIENNSFKILPRMLIVTPGTDSYSYAESLGRLKNPIAYLKSLSVTRQFDDITINITGLTDEVIKEHMRRLQKITIERGLV